MISIVSVCIVHCNHCNVSVGVFVCSVYFILSVNLPTVSPFYLLVISSLAEPLTMHRRAKGFEEPQLGNTALELQLNLNPNATTINPVVPSSIRTLSFSCRFSTYKLIIFCFSPLMTVTSKNSKNFTSPIGTE